MIYVNHVSCYIYSRASTTQLFIEWFGWLLLQTPLFSKSSRAACLTDEPGLFFLKKTYFTVPISFTLVWRPIHVQGLG